MYFLLLGYAETIKSALFTLPQSEIEAVKKAYQEKVPEFLVSQFTERRNKDEAAKQYKIRMDKASATLYPHG